MQYTDNTDFSTLSSLPSSYLQVSECGKTNKYETHTAGSTQKGEQPLKSTECFLFLGTSTRSSSTEVS